MQIIPLQPDDQDRIEQTAALLIAGFKERAPHSWPDMTAALEEVQESLQSDKISRIAIDEQGSVLGWIGGRSGYDGNAWELHPLVVHPDYQGQGIGRALVVDFEMQVKAQGAITIYLGTDDEAYQTSLGGADLYPNVFEHLTNIQNLDRHPYEFYQKLGYVIVGIIPDANGIGKPDIFMAKRVSA
jgi:aminoglycoside 6'-N-acetyltransferase I